MNSFVNLSLQASRETLQHHRSRKLEQYIKSATPLLEFDEEIFKKIITQIIVITQEKVRFILSNGQQIEINYRLGKYKFKGGRVWSKH